MNSEQKIFVVDKLVQMTDVLDMNGISYQGVPSQIKCPVHKAGHETKRSARIFPDNYIWCYTCAKQFPPTEIHAALLSISREEAADRLLAAFPAAAEKIKETLREYHTPRKKPTPVALLSQANIHLVTYRHKVPLKAYRSWVFRMHQLQAILTETAEEHQPGKLLAFLQQMNGDLAPLMETT